MHRGRTIFAQLMDWLPKYEFDTCVRRYGGNRRVRRLTCYDQFLILAFAQLTFRESLRDIETCLQALGAKVYHCGIRGKTARSTLADANEKRDWRIFADFAHVLIERATRLYGDEDFGIERLVELTVAMRGEPFARLAEELFTAVARHTGGTPPHDDRTLLMVRRQG